MIPTTRLSGLLIIISNLELTNVDSNNWPAILEKILDSDIIIFATPIWWGIQSSLIQRVIERLDELHDEIM